MGVNPTLPPGTVQMQSSGSNFMFFPGTTNPFSTKTMTPTMQFLSLQQAALNAGLDPAGSTTLFPPGLTSLFPPGLNVTPPVGFMNPFIGFTPLGFGATTGINPFLVAAGLNGLTPFGPPLSTPATPLVLGSGTFFTVSPSVMFLGAPGMNSLPLVGLGSLATGGMTTPATLPFVITLNDETTLTPQGEREMMRKIRLVKSQTGASATTIWSASDLNTLLDDVKDHPDRMGIDLPLSEQVLGHINIVPSQSNANAGLLKNPRHWPELLQGKAFQDERDQIDVIIPELVRQALAGSVKLADLKNLDRAVKAMRDKLAGMIRDVPDPMYIRAKRFVVDLQSGVKALSQPDAGNYFNAMYSPKVKSVRELVRYMAKSALRFAPAVTGDEAAYLVLYQSLAAYDVSANTQAPKFISLIAAAR
jgi:hypothetical protein